jgi:hypothetical protein
MGSGGHACGRARVEPERAHAAPRDRLHRHPDARYPYCEETEASSTGRRQSVFLWRYCGVREYRRECRRPCDEHVSAEPETAEGTIRSYGSMVFSRYQLGESAHLFGTICSVAWLLCSMR